MTARFTRYVAIGDSSTEGLDDPDGQGGYRGWADRLAETVAQRQGGLLYANLAVRGRRTARIRAEQLAPALTLEPDLVTIFLGMNDLLVRRFDLAGLRRDVETVHDAVAATGATIVTFTMPDFGPVMPLARLLDRRVAALNRVIRGAAARSGARVVDFARYPVAADPRLWSEDRLHANTAGHRRIAAALAEALGMGAPAEDWRRPLAPLEGLSGARRLAREGRWMRRHLVPWLLRHARGRSSGDGRRPKRPCLRPVVTTPAGPAP